MRVQPAGSVGYRTEDNNYTEEQMIGIAINSMRMAISFHNQRNSELTEIAVKSSDIHHRIAAAWALGFESLTHDEAIKSLHVFRLNQANKIQTLHLRRVGNNRHAQAHPNHIILFASLQNFPVLEPAEKKPFNNCLLLLMRDKNPLVVSAARDSCSTLAARNHNDLHVDFGPTYNCEWSARDDAALLWEVYFEKKAKNEPNSGRN